MKSIKEIPKAFIGFLIASILIWFLITFSKEYTSVITFPISYSKLSQGQLLQKEPDKEMDILVKGSGFKILSCKFNTISIKLKIDNLAKKRASKYYLIPKNQQVAIQKQLVKGVEVIQLLKDTIFLDIGNLRSKRVAVQPTLNIKYQIGYDISKQLKLIPDSITISGPEKQINGINKLKTSTLELEGVKTDFEETVFVIRPKNSENINFSQETVKVFGKVEKFTESSFHVPFRVTNLPEDIHLSTLTKTVQVFFVVALSDFNKVDVNSFKVECDYLVSEQNNLGYLIPKIVFKPSLVKNVKVVPNKIDFLIQK